MALSDEVTSRYPNSRLIELTNAGDESASTINTTVLGLAATDAEAEFEEIAGLAYDGTDDRHVRAGVKGVIALLYKWGASPGAAADAAYDEFKEACESVGRVTGRNRVKPTTSSVLTPTSEQQGTETVRPDTDRDHYDKLVPDAPK